MNRKVNLQTGHLQSAFTKCTYKLGNGCHTKVDKCHSKQVYYTIAKMLPHDSRLLIFNTHGTYTKYMRMHIKGN